ncbi:phage tail tape measure protein [Fusobacterium necrophorum subsp. funduliforme]|uniref:phage tail tape measure protein n=1 Tax=Fusobacterium necrophorum TaxID=859 RepID=UPI0007882CAA|nr:phage tail tape measure protein [Fusobacterium necrophorum]AYV93782.1 phage tail tape measure protein [Fusobacterium necrophorum subsp. funduliforme]KYM45025.1 tail tape measure protein [Fusobacterium necrophorum subsp. funduliforme]
MSHTVEMSLSFQDNSKEALESLAKAMGKTTKQMEEELKKVAKAFQEFEEMAKRTNLFEKIQKDAEKHLKQVENRFKSMQEKAKQSFGIIEKIARRTFLAMATFTGFAVRGFADYEYSIKKIQTISKDSYETISTNIRKMAYETGTSSKELASSLYDIVQVIQDSPDKYKMLDTVNKLSIAGFTDTTQAAELLNSIMLTYGMTVNDLVKVSNKLIVTQNLGNTTIGKMAHNLGTLIPQAKMANVSLDEVLATVATLTLGGIRTDKATTGLRAMLSELSNESSKLGKEFKKITGGLDFKNYTLSGGTIIGALKLIQEKAKDADKAMTEMFGNIRSKTAAGGLAILEKKYTQVLNAIANAPNDQLARAYATMLDTTKANLERIKMVVSTYTQEIGERVAKDLAGALNINDVKSFEDLFNEKNIDKVYSFGKAIFFVTGGITALGIALKGIETVTAAFALLHNPAVLLIASLGGVYYGIRKILDIKNEEFEKTKKWLNETEEGLKKQVETLKEIQKQKEQGGFTSLKPLRELEGFSPKVLADLERLNNLKVNAYNQGNINEFERLAKEFREIMEREIQRLEKETIRLNAKVFVDVDVVRENSRQKAFESLLNIEDIDKISKEFHSGKYKGNKNEKFIYEDYLKQLDSLNVSKRSTLRRDISEAISGIAKKSYNPDGDKKGSKKDPFKELISELGAKIKRDLGIQEKIEILERAKEKFKKNINEINTAIDNFKIEALANKIKNALEGVNLRNHEYSSGEQLGKIQAGEKLVLQQLEMARKVNNSDLVRDLEKQMKQLDFTKFLIPVEEKIKEIEKNLKSTQEQSEKIKENKDNLSSAEIKRIQTEIAGTVAANKALIENMKGYLKQNLENGMLTQGDYDKLKQTVDNLDTSSDKLKNAAIKVENSIPGALNAIGNAFSQLGNVTGSQTLGGIGSIFGGLGSIGDLVGKFKSGGGIGSILGMFSKTGSLSGGMASLGTVASGVAAGIGIVSTIGSLFGRSGKKKAAAIDARNKENEEAYKKQISALQQLTQAIQQNSERIKSFADRMLTDVAKNPTIKMIFGGESNFDLLHHSMIAGKHFADITALEKGSKRYRSGFRKKSKSTYTKVDIGESELLRYLGFSKSELDAFTDSEMKQLDSVLHNVNHETLRRATGRNLTESSIEEWKKQVHEFVEQIKYLEKEKADLFKGSTLESFTGVEYKTEKELIKEYTEQFKQMGLVGEQYNETIKEMAKNNQVLITSMLDVRNSTIEGFASGNGGFLSSMKSYFEKIFKNASSVAYDVVFSDLDHYLTQAFEKISNKLVNIKKNGKLDFKGLFSDFDFEKLKNLDIMEKQVKQSLDVIKKELLSHGVDLSLINKMLPWSDFNDRINDLKNALSSAMNAGLEEHKFSSFTKALGQSLYDSVKNSLVKAFSESALYQGMIEKFIRAENFQAQLEKAGNFKDVLGIADGIMKKFSYELEAAGLGGFDAINNIRREEDTQLGNAYYTDKAANVNITFNNTYNGDIYGFDDFESINRKMWLKNMEEYRLKPNGSN